MLECLQLCGVRSYSPTEDATITFDPKLTIIHGHNGAGKTTIIEALKVVTTGVYPPNSDNGRTFVTDPKLANLPEVHAAVRIRFRTHRGKTIKAAKLITVTRRSAKLTIKSSECQVAVMSDGGKFEVKSMNVSAFEEFVPELMGVSSAVLQNVTFCHQDKTLWPFSDSAELKGIFDEIFSTESYSKAHETHRKYLKAKEQILLDKRKELEILKEREETFIQKQLERQQIDAQIAKMMEENEELQYRARLEREKSDFYRKLESKYQLFTKKKHDLENGTTIIQQLQAQMPICDFQTVISPGEIQQAEESLSKLTAELTQTTQTHRKICDSLLRNTAKIDNLKGNLSEIEAVLGQKRLVLSQICESFSIDVSLLEEDELAISELESINNETDQRDIEGKKSQFQQAKSEYDQCLDSLKTTQAALTHCNKCVSERQTTLAKLKSESELAQSLNFELKNASNELSKTKESLKVLENERKKLCEEMKETAEIIEEIEGKARKERSEIEIFTVWTEICGLFRAHKVLQKHENAKFSDILQLLRVDWVTTTQEIANIKSQMQLHTSELKSYENAAKSIKINIATIENERNSLQTDLADTLGFTKSQELSQNDYSEFANGLETRMKGIETEIIEMSERKRLFEEIRDRSLAAKSCETCKKDIKPREMSEFHTNFNDKLTKIDSEMTEIQQKKEVARLEIAVCTQNKEKIDQFLRLSRRKAELEASLLSTDMNFSQKTAVLSVFSTTLCEFESFFMDLKAATAAWEGLLSSKPLTFQEFLSVSYLSASRHLASSSKPAPHFSMKLLELTDRKAILDARGQVVNRQIDMNQSQINRCERDINRIKSEQISIGDSGRIGIESEIERLTREISEFAVKEREWREAESRAKAVMEGVEKDWNGLLVRQGQKRLVIDRLKQTVEGVKSEERRKNGVRDEIGKAGEYSQRMEKERDMMGRRVEDGERKKKELQDLLSTYSLQSQYHKQSALLTLKLSEQSQLALDLASLQSELSNYSPEAHKQLTALLQRLEVQISEITGRLAVLNEAKRKMLGATGTQNITEMVMKAGEEIACITQLVEEHKVFLRALDNAIMSYHALKISQVNSLLRDFWRLTYRGHDIDTIELRAEPDLTKKVKTYNYRLVLHGAESDMDMRGRCSAGQKVLASIVLRLALAQAFSGVCGVIALDEPTTNLDRENSLGLAEALASFVSSQQGIQMIVITHDRDFVEALLRLTQQGTFYQVEKRKEMSTLSLRTIR